MEYSDTTDDLAYITSLEQRVIALESVMQDAEFILRKVAINWKEAGSLSDSAIRCVFDIHKILHKAV